MSDKLSPMQEQLLGQASNILQSVTETVSKAADFASSQVPDIALQYVTYGRASASAFIVVGFLFLLAAWWMVFRVCIKDVYKMSADGRAFIGIFGGILSTFGGLTILFANINNFLMVWFAPKVWLIKELVNLVK